LPAASGKAHQMINTSDTALEYFCFSSLSLPEVVFYPDSDKIGAITPGDAAGGPMKGRRAAFLRNEPRDYWDREAPD
jgi:hypothetical protein